MGFKIQIRDGLPIGSKVNIRDTGGATLGNDIGDLLQGQVGYGDETMGTLDGQYYCLKITSGATVGWAYARWNWNDTNAIISTVEEPPSGETFVVEIYDGDALVKSNEVDALNVNGTLDGDAVLEYTTP